MKTSQKNSFFNNFVWKLNEEKAFLTILNENVRLFYASNHKLSKFHHWQTLPTQFTTLLLIKGEIKSHLSCIFFSFCEVEKCDRREKSLKNENLNSLFAVCFEASSSHLIECDAIVLLPVDLLLVEGSATFFQLANLKFKRLKMIEVMRNS